MSDTERELLIVVFEAARKAIQTVGSGGFENLDEQLKLTIKKLKDEGDSC